jgi:ribose transport system ATP-binding protein
VNRTLSELSLSENDGADVTGLVVSNLRRAFGETVALDDVSLNVPFGKVHAVFGENGSGKSTLVKILAGVLSPNRGSVTISGRELAPASPRLARSLGIVTVFQEVLVAPNRSVTENVFLGFDSWRRWKVPKRDRDATALAALAEFSQGTFEPRAQVGTLSLVHQQQIAIARALILEPRILVLDESTAAMDVADRDLFFDALRKRVATGLGVVFISHRMDEVLSLSDSATVLRSGSRIATLAKDEISESQLLSLLAHAEAP